MKISKGVEKMRKSLLIGIISLLAISTLIVPASALKFNDVPDTHWAADAVYDLVRMGITKGYPDGTFRGNKNITRYETAILLSKLAKYVGSGGSAVDEAAVKALVRDEIASLRTGKSEGWEIGGTYKARFLLNDIIGNGAKSINPTHRLQLNLAKSLASNIKFGVNLDTRTTSTTNAGFGTGTDYLNWGQYDILAAGLLDWWATADVNFLMPLKVELSNGIGDSFHKGDKLTVTNSTLADNLTLGVMYGRNSVTSNRNASNKYSGTLVYDIPGLVYLGNTKLDAAVTQYANTAVVNPFSAGNRNWNLLSKVDVNPMSNLKLQGRLGLSGSTSTALYLAALMQLDLANLLGEGASLFLEGHKLGSQYITTYGDSWVGTDVMDYYITDSGNDGETYLGGIYLQPIVDRWAFQGRFTVNLNGNRLGTAYLTRIEPGLIYQAAGTVKTYAYYRYNYNHTAGTSADRIEVGAEIKI